MYKPREYINNEEHVLKTNKIWLDIEDTLHSLVGKIHQKSKYGIIYHSGEKKLSKNGKLVKLSFIKIWIFVERKI